MLIAPRDQPYRALVVDDDPVLLIAIHQFIARLGFEVQSANNGQHALELFIDLDGFKGINDTRGHAAGDRVLCQVAARLLEVVRRPDTVARLGGDAFAVLLRDVSENSGVLALGERLLAAICAPIALPDGPVGIGASIGISLFPANGPDGAALLRRADEAMYEVKTAGKRGGALATLLTPV
ncbi:GGDEF domain-containing protein [uncultured Thiodictyon sp.]|uniref:GGDEF domain-containing protein n=1 Tax=uncultured Thiodictyon sp. TaxID=1846217 RepID=UPI0025E34AAF|nr:GGDEF domain-containing protein [uncultured Thiodictyon sp.]